MEQLARWAGVYHYHRIGFDERPLELCADGTIREEGDGAERLWSVSEDEAGAALSIGGPLGELCRLRLERDGAWRGRWLRYERMSVELVPRSLQPYRSLEDRGGIRYEPEGFHYVSYAQLVRDCHELARRLPPVRAVAGVPRSGMIPASLIALELNAPMIPLEDLMRDEPPVVPLPRRAFGRRVHDGVVLVVDDTSASGRQVDRLRELIRHPVRFAAVYVEDRPKICVDYFHSKLPTVAQFYEWTMFHDGNNAVLLTDFDGVLCDDWRGGNEDENLASYTDFLRSAPARRIPSQPLRGIVTNRLERHRPETEEWLKRHGVEFGFLSMSPHATFIDRNRANDVAARKAALFGADPSLKLFVESDDAQARQIVHATGKPVFSVERNGLV